MQTRNFQAWLATFRQSINGYCYYTDFDKVYAHAESLKIEINILNSLINSKKVEDDFNAIIQNYPKCLKVIPLLLAVRKREIYCQDANGSVNYVFDPKKNTIEEYRYFMRETGLFNLLQNHLISNLYDYIIGVEVGLDSNGRKNRGGHQMENLVRGFLDKTGVKYYPEMYIHEIEQKWNIDLSPISANGTATKRWDFVVHSHSRTFVIETNFYSSSGSKLNETARSYKMIAEEARAIQNFVFVWVTDGKGWNHASHNLKETFDVLPTLYNITDMENNAFAGLFA